MVPLNRAPGSRAAGDPHPWSPGWWDRSPVVEGWQLSWVNSNQALTEGRFCDSLNESTFIELAWVKLESNLTQVKKSDSNWVKCQPQVEQSRRHPPRWRRCRSWASGTDRPRCIGRGRTKCCPSVPGRRSSTCTRSPGLLFSDVMTFDVNRFYTWIYFEPNTALKYHKDHCWEISRQWLEISQQHWIESLTVDAPVNPRESGADVPAELLRLLCGVGVVDADEGDGLVWVVIQ